MLGVCTARSLVFLVGFCAGPWIQLLWGGLAAAGGELSIPFPGTELCVSANLVWRSFGFRAAGGATSSQSFRDRRVWSGVVA